MKNFQAGLKKASRGLGSLLAAAALSTLVFTADASAQKATGGMTRIKDIVDFEGVRDNMLIGYGLVVGLNGTGDSLNNSPFTEQSIIGMLDRLGVNVRDEKLNTKNIAAVMVTATLPPFTNQGTRIDVSISALGDSKSLQGGTLLVTPLLSADGQVYAVAQGPVSIAGFSAKGDAGSVTQNIPTTGRISAGAIVEREIPFALEGQASTRLSLRNPDFTTARRIAAAINSHLKFPAAVAQNPASVEVKVPPGYNAGLVNLLTDIEQLRIAPDQVARVVIDERSGVIVMGKDVRISTVALAQGNLTIRITETPQVSQPQPFSEGGETVVVPRTDIQVLDDGEGKKLAVLPEGVSLQELVTNLNALGVGPRDIITILQAIKASGAMQAEIEVM
ncbi:MAG TPA: flagellar basal body P-ring protein FlgI [Alphaproteobacteria bacterium]|nr:flagellar basal body P-ring protein FlgI [Alphaproteobacteria bacterium]HCS23223.1 flagellar biosynthesis protein FlgA [Rhodospirillaceae bacterium]HRI77701.1 flagellar basal body P-ring protein FlgI [Alphaproteobacteria bacterium]HRJ67717.1 flagellar basal body P-ring protein FlgI [Alphaproteobacteria bacterium]